MDECDLEPEHAAPGRLVDQLGAGRREPAQRRAEVSDLVRDVVHPGAALGEEAADGRVVRERAEQLDAALADAQRRRLDALLLDPRAMLEARPEETLVRRHRGVEILDRHADVMDRRRAFHAADRM
jgi:hypothetical protein